MPVTVVDFGCMSYPSPNYAMELTATRRVFTFQMIKPLLLRTTLALASGSSS